MPSFVLNTNVASSAIPETFLEDVTQLLHTLLGKPMKFISVHVSGDHQMAFAGSREPCALAALCCIGKIGLEENKTYSSALMELITAQLHIPADRMYISFTNMEPQNVGWSGKTFAK